MAPRYSQPTTTAGVERAGARGDGFDLAREAFASEVKDLRVDPLDLSPERVGGTFDVVMLLGVLYHTRDPLLVLEHVRSVTKKMLILETEAGMLLTRRPAVEFFPGTELNNDPTNWWAPNERALVGMLHRWGSHRSMSSGGATFHFAPRHGWRTYEGRRAGRSCVRSRPTGSSSTPTSDVHIRRARVGV